MWSFLFPFFPSKQKRINIVKNKQKHVKYVFLHELSLWMFQLHALWSCFITRLNKANSSYWLLKRRSWRRERVIAGSPPAVLLDWAGWTWRRKTNKQPRDQQNIPASLKKWEPDFKSRHLLANVGWVLKWTHQPRRLWHLLTTRCLCSCSSQPDVWPPGAELGSAGRGPDPPVHDPQGRGDLHAAHCGTGP